MPTATPVLSFDQVVERLRVSKVAQRSKYLAMYSSWLGGIVTDPECMSVPIDDHMVHRGDGVFEAIKCVGGKVYALDRHLERLMESARQISLATNLNVKDLHSLCLETARVAKSTDFLFRVYLSRGPGDFSPNPYSTVGSQLYIVITPYAALAPQKFNDGVKAGLSEIAVKEGFFANVKSCNYLPNVLMKKEAVDRELDFTVSIDEAGHLAEGSTENFAIVSRDGDFLVPSFARTLRGITASRSIELAESLVRSGFIRAVKNSHVRPADLAEAREAMFLGTTIDCLPVTTFEGAAVGDGKVGPFCRELLKLLKEDMRQGPLATPIS